MSPHKVEAAEQARRGARVRRRADVLLDRWPFQRKLNVLVIIPVAVVAAILVYVVAGQVAQAQSAARTAALVRNSEQVASLVDDLQREHQQAILLSVHYQAAEPGGPAPSPRDYRRAQRAVDRQVAEVRSAFGSRLPAAEGRALQGVAGLTGLRKTVEGAYLPAESIDPAYGPVVSNLIDGLGLGGSAGGVVSSPENVLDTLLRADAAHATFETGVFSAQTGDSSAFTEFTGAVGSLQLYNHHAQRFTRIASAAQSSQLTRIERNAHQNAIRSEFASLQFNPSSLEAENLDEVRAAVDKAIAAYPTYEKQASTRLEVTRSLIHQIADDSDRASSEAWWRVGWLLAGVVLIFAFWLLLSLLVRRSVVRPVRMLTAAAQQVARATGQELARVADDEAEDDTRLRLKAVPVPVRDEIGTLAEAFNEVQETAAALLQRQVLSRRNVAEMFGNVGRRVDNLTARQLALIDAVEREETDPALLDQLYQIDHLAVRLQRNADSLMLLAGVAETALEARPTALTNVVRAALGEIEEYQRIHLRVLDEVTVAPDIVGDLTLMLAELMENAVAFSPAESRVEVRVRSQAEGAVVEVVDHGLGLSAERLKEENERLVRRERLDLAPTKVLGLFVVGRIARRWGIGATLTPTLGGGVTSRVFISSTLLVPPSRAPATFAGDDDSPSSALSTRSGPAGPAKSPALTGPAETSAVPPQHPRPSRWAPAGTAPQDSTGKGPAPLPRRIPRTAHAAGPAPETGSGNTAERATAEAREHPDGEARTPAPATPPLRRRVRGATLTNASAARQPTPTSRQPLDAEAVRSSIEEFEEAVERAERESAQPGQQPTQTPATPEPPEGPEGVGQ
ncbi:ATP-binding protein [Streptomyces sp. NPDC005393]|uniref:sensor histidine kinase n=1 Tax=Streptomyces sp. NPDC005393 TaxID=3157041 RepID=UPI0033A1F43B